MDPPGVFIVFGIFYIFYTDTDTFYTDTNRDLRIIFRIVSCESYTDQGMVVKSECGKQLIFSSLTPQQGSLCIFWDMDSEKWLRRSKKNPKIICKCGGSLVQRNRLLRPIEVPGFESVISHNDPGALQALRLVSYSLASLSRQ